MPIPLPSREQIDEVTLRNYRNLTNVSKLLYNSEVSERLGYKYSPWQILSFLRMFGRRLGHINVISDIELNRLMATGEVERFMEALHHRKVKEIYGKPQPRSKKGAGKGAEPADDGKAL